MLPGMVISINVIISFKAISHMLHEFLALAEKKYICFILESPPPRVFLNIQMPLQADNVLIFAELYLLSIVIKTVNNTVRCFLVVVAEVEHGKSTIW